MILRSSDPGIFFPNAPIATMEERKLVMMVSLTWCKLMTYCKNPESPSIILSSLARGGRAYHS